MIVDQAGDQSHSKFEEVRSLKARFHKSGPLWIYWERSDLTYFY